MAIGGQFAASLIQLCRENGLSGRFAMLGRQRWTGASAGASATAYHDQIAASGLNLPDAYLAPVAEHNDLYTEPLFEAIGFDRVDSIDMSDFEGATITQDLSAPLPDNLHEKFDVIYDGGTCEHVFDIAAAYRNLHRMLKPGGVLIAHSPNNGWLNHGFYQICPELVYGFWKQAQGYDVLSCTLIPTMPRFGLLRVPMTDPTVTGKRPRMGRALKRVIGSRLMLEYAVRKPSGSAGSGIPQQTDYQNRWRDRRPGGQ